MQVIIKAGGYACQNVNIARLGTKCAEAIYPAIVIFLSPCQPVTDIFLGRIEIAVSASFRQLVKQSEPVIKAQKPAIKPFNSRAVQAAEMCWFFCVASFTQIFAQIICLMHYKATIWH